MEIAAFGKEVLFHPALCKDARGNTSVSRDVAAVEDHRDGTGVTACLNVDRSFCPEVQIGDVIMICVIGLR